MLHLLFCGRRSTDSTLLCATAQSCFPLYFFIFSNDLTGKVSYYWQMLLNEFYVFGSRNGKWRQAFLIFL